LENKKQLNAIKFELEEERARFKGMVEEKAQENKRLRDNLLLVNDENDELRQKEDANRRQIDSLQAEKTSLKQQIADLQN
jgi:cell division protein FtsB